MGSTFWRHTGKPGISITDDTTFELGISSNDLAKIAKNSAEIAAVCASCNAAIICAATGGIGAILIAAIGSYLLKIGSPKTTTTSSY